jgi:ribokinase
MESMPHEEALAFACAAGACAAMKPGAQPSLPTRAEVKALL